MLRGVLYALFITLAIPSLSQAQEYEKGLFGIGLIVGEPTGVSAKYYLGEDADYAVDGAIGAGLIDTGIHAHGDFLLHPWILERQEAFDMPLYVGPGLRFLLEDGGRGLDDIVHVGIRGVVGALFDFRKLPLDVFIEVAPILEWKFSDNDDEAGLGFSINAAAGVRYYF